MPEKITRRSSVFSQIVLRPTVFDIGIIQSNAQVKRKYPMKNRFYFQVLLSTIRAV